MNVPIEVFFDIDGCLINERYEFTEPIEKVIEKSRQCSDMKLHLNSNRSLQSMLKKWDELRFNGFLVYENGLGIYDPSTREDHSIGTPIDREHLKRILLKMSDEVSFVSTDELVRTPERFQSDKEREIYCEESRIFTATVYPRLIVDRVPTPDIMFLDEVRKRLVKEYGDKYDIPEFDGKSYFNILMNPRDALKSNPMRGLAGENRIASFGDNITDIEMFKKSDKGMIGCPANAVDDVKYFVVENNGFVADKEYTQGAIDFLDYLREK